MYFPPADLPPTPFRAPKSCTPFPRLTSLARHLLGDESGWDLPSHFRLQHVGLGPDPASAPRTELLLRQRGKSSARFVFSHTTANRSRLVFAMNGVGQVEGEIFRPTSASASAEEDTLTSPVTNEGEVHPSPPSEGDGRGVRWGYDPNYLASNSYSIPSYIDFFWKHSYYSSKNNYLRASLTVGGMLPGILIPLPLEAGGFNVGGTLLTVRGSWALGIDCQVRSMWLDLTGGRCYLNSVLAYQRPTFSLNLNVHSFGERLITSIVADPVGLAKSLAKLPTLAKEEDLYNCTWLVGVEADTVTRGGAYHVQRLSLALTRRHTSPSPFTTEATKADDTEQIFRTDQPLLRNGENKVKFDAINMGLGSVLYRLSMHTDAHIKLSPAHYMRIGGSVQADVMPFDPNSLRFGLSATFVC